MVQLFDLQLDECPVFSGRYWTLHWSTLERAKAEGREEDIDAACDTAFGQLRERIENELL